MESISGHYIQGSRHKGEHSCNALISTPGCLKRRELCLNIGTEFSTKGSDP